MSMHMSIVGKKLTPDHPGAGSQQLAPITTMAVQTPQPVTSGSIETPLTESQTEILSISRTSDDSSRSRSESFAIHLRGQLDAMVFRDALTALVGRHDAFRFTYKPNSERVRFHEVRVPELPVTDLSDVSEPERLSTIEAFIRAHANHPFDFAAGPLVRFNLLRLGRDEHIFLLTYHELAIDRRSFGILIGELAKLYSSRLNGIESSLLPAASFRSYALAQNHSERSPARAEAEAWWVSKFRTAVPPLDLPTDRPRRTVRTYAGSTVRQSASAATARAIGQCATQGGWDMFEMFLAGYEILIHRLGGQDDLAVGIPATSLTHSHTSLPVGPCDRVIPHRTSFDDDPTVSALVNRVHDSLQQIASHQYYSSHTLAQTLGIRQDPSRLTFAEVQFTLDRGPAGLTFSGLEVDVQRCPKSFVYFDLALSVVESDAGGLSFALDYNRDLFDESTAFRWLGYYETILISMASDPDQPVSLVQLIRETKRRQLIKDWNATKAEYPRDLCAHQLIDAQAVRTPDAIAVVCEAQTLTYAELVQGTNCVAQFLISRGIRTGDRVVICLDRSIDMVFALFGVLKSGAAYVPLDPDFPRERIAGMVDDARPALILTRREIADRLTLPADCVVCIDSARAEINRADVQLPPTNVTPDDTAYVIYTSGSTGKPKGVEIPHRAVVNFLMSMARQPGLDHRDVLLAVTTLSFDIAVLELYLPLIVGGRVVIATRDDTRDGLRLQSLMRSSGVTVMQATPATWSLLIESGWTGNSEFKVLCGGEALTRDLADELLARSESVWNMYGPTESTVWSSVLRVTPGREPVRVGPPIANTEFYVLDSRRHQVPIGVAGELHIGGVGLARGYWERPELTSEKFIPDTFRPGPGRRLYRTGDLVRLRADGTLDFLGRIDNQVKIRGFRIETGDVEHAIKQFPGIRDCVVVARDVAGENQLVGYFVANGNTPQTSQLRTHLASLLPGYMIPAAFVALEALPRTPNGKIDRRSLPTVIGRDVPTEAPTPDPGEEYAFPATVWQQTFWYLDRLNPGNPGLNIPLRFRLSGPLRVKTLEEALTEIVRRHEALRTRFSETGGELLQVVAPPSPVPLPVDPVRSESDLSHAEMLTLKDARAPFDLESGPLFRARLLRFSSDDHILLLNVHHMVADGWSTGLISDEVAELYAAFESGRPSPLAEPALQFGDFAVWQADWLRTQVVADQLAYWKKRLAGIEPIRVPYDQTPSAEFGLPGRIESILLPRELTNALADLNTRHGVTLFMTCMACFKLLLCLRTSQTDVSVGTVVAGRSRTELESVVGMFVNTIILRTDLSGDPTFVELLDRVRTTVLEAMDHQDVPFGSIIEALRLGRAKDRNPLFGVNFIFQRAFLKPHRSGAITITPIPSISPGTMLDLNWFMVERDEGWRLSCMYSPHEYEPDTILWLLNSFQELLRQAVAEPNRSISRYALPPMPERPDSNGRPISDKRMESVPIPVSPAVSTRNVAACDDIEKRVADIWRQVLRLEQLGLDDDFFDLGGHSLLAARLVAKIHDGFGIRLSPALLNEYSTVRLFSRVLRESRCENPVVESTVRHASLPQLNARETLQARETSDARAHSLATTVLPATKSGLRSSHFFFPSPEGPLYGVYSPPEGGARSECVILCSPPGHEYMSTHWCLRLLASDLARAGFHVLRFDYSCLGDSWGSFEQANLYRWERDIVTAMQIMKDRTRISDISVVGLRLGATLAYRATLTESVRHLILWDPIVNGREYLGQLRRMQMEIHPHTKPIPNADEELLGYDYSASLVAELDRLDLISAGLPRCRQTSLVLGDETNGYKPFREFLERQTPLPTVRFVADHVRWNDAGAFDSHVMPHQARRAVVEVLRRAVP